MSEMFERLETAVSEACDWALPPHLLKKAIRAALEAMREPTAEMREAGFQHTGDPCWQEDVGRAWRAMIDTALGKVDA